MRKISDIDMATNFVTLRERHPRLAMAELNEHDLDHANWSRR